MRKVTEKTFKAYAKEAVKQLNTLELFTALHFTAVGAEFSLYRNGAEVGHISIQDNGWVYAKDFARDDEFEIIPERDTMKDLFKAVYATVNGLLDSGWFMQEEPEQVEEAEKQEGRTITVTLHPEDEEEEKTITYTGVKTYGFVAGKVAKMIESHTDGSCIDKNHEYLVVVFRDLTETVFRRSSVVEVKEGNRIMVNGWDEDEPTAEEPQPTPEEADREVTYIDFKPEQDYSEEEQKEIAETVAGVGLELLEKELTELEAASSKAYEKEWKKYMDAVKTLARLINMDTKTARQMLLRGSKNREKVWNYLKRMKVYENK